MNLFSLNDMPTHWAGLVVIGVCCLFSPYTQAQEQEELNRVVLTPEQRAKIDAERLAYLKSLKVNQVEDEKEEPPVKKSGSATKSKKRIILPRKLTVSAVIETPEGKKWVRVNDKFNEIPSKHVNIEYPQSNPKGAQFKVDTRGEVFVPVGSTYLPRSNKIVETYKLDAKTRKADAKQQILQANQKTIERTLKDVKTVNTPPVKSESTPKK
ncbi:hypothetical protein QCB44_07630 [Thiomicrorhabdus sp. zzn3]|uniref:hypothetical protein n=1 Tax=Thiomicrorhabdus sp. zzn3 TaxID=3039775 RepID=UPI0024370BD5|nr:hypothetical protein [Thiomicrorhabdus sp. zzn3]MDG6778571.1 hypothetical protein [Thiomicrorhabdus sp. zzn3]